MPNDPQNQPVGPPPDLNATDPYKILAVPRSADRAEIKRRYFSLIREYTPEKDPAAFKIIRGAYETLKNTQRRAEVDILTPKAPPPWQGDFKINTRIFKNGVPTNIATDMLKQWGDLGRKDFSDDFRELVW